MTNQIALLLGLLILAGLGADFYLWDGQYTLFLARKFSDLIEWIAFWR